MSGTRTTHNVPGTFTGRNRIIRFVEELAVVCPYCGEAIDVEVELPDGSEQQFVEDCAVCCRPVYFDVKIGFDGMVSCNARREDGE